MQDSDNQKLHILYASEGGHAWDVADYVADLAEKKQIRFEQNELNEISVSDLKSLSKVMIICSTTGDGDVPMTGEDFWDELEEALIDLSDVEYSVCALGDSSFPHFCGAGKKIDERLHELGAVRVSERKELDRLTDGWENWALKTFFNLGYA